MLAGTHRFSRNQHEIYSFFCYMFGIGCFINYIHHLSKNQCEGYGLIMLYTCGSVSVSIWHRQEGWWNSLLAFSPSLALSQCEGYGLILLYWAIQAGLLSPLTFAWHHLSPLAAFTSGAYFLHNGRRWQWICEFYTANLKGIFGGL